MGIKLGLSMKYHLLSVSKSKKLRVLNIGDYIQALATSKYYPEINGFIDRDVELKSYDGEPTKVIMNGWYMQNSENWPPSEKIHPLFVAFHINSAVREVLTSPESIQYLKRFEPIGCRDTYTLDLLRSKGINAYCSGCMTLTLGKSFLKTQKEESIYIVDPIIKLTFSFSQLLLNGFYFLRHRKEITELGKKKNLLKKVNFLRKSIALTDYLRTYGKVFDKSILFNAEYICQEDEYYLKNFDDDFARLKEAERLVMTYSKAGMVITTRIHCALPCLGLETKVIYLSNEDVVESNKCRLGGLKDLFNVLEYRDNKLFPKFEFKSLLSLNNCPENKETWKNLAKSLDERCVDFVN